MGDPLTKTISVQVAGGSAVGPDKTFRVVLYAPFNSVVSNDTAVGTIQNLSPPDELLPGDVDGGGQVQFSDFVILADNFGRTWNAAPARSAAAALDVPAELDAAIGGNGDDHDMATGVLPA